MLKKYHTVAPYGENEITIQKSRFITYVKRTETEEAALEFIQDIKRKHPAANHNCSAYMIGEHDLIQKANDDGEPSGTAGVPILEVLKKRKLKDTTIVVTRYFGGIKLGGGGLIRAYGRSATEGINAAGVVERRLNRLVTTTIDYTWLGKVENEIRNSSYPLKEISYLENVAIESFVEEDETESFTSWITELTNGQASVEIGEQLYREEKISAYFDNF
ncbi:YigZ family protein [Jeotgalibacillus proteolyticus]|uniref:YigZ family protein n=1 Tax=Jeotgalibacillus proteolyticus TaxID=2082395 RepID=A0A2S5GBH5_9BACL|nr:YigZ family protein [Jeotgalibacillus proteolyticus]PPA70264.1 YigZ family protein [Jeotgalibacillus proteolyticus]